MKSKIKYSTSIITSLLLILLGGFLSSTFVPLANANFKTEKKVTLQEPVIKTIIKLKGVAFEENTAIFKESSYKRLDMAVKALKKYSSIDVVIASHMSKNGNSRMSQLLTEQRAKVVNDYFVLHGVSHSQLTYKGYGWDLPLSSNKTEKGRQINERMELRVY